jgi:hypothetical protein
MNLICKLFGHAPLTRAGYSGWVGYAAVLNSTTDGVGVTHLYLQAKCPRCGEHYRICNVHQPNYDEQNTRASK